jgi:hypothetical protein
MDKRKMEIYENLPPALKELVKIARQVENESELNEG